MLARDDVSIATLIEHWIAGKRVTPVNPDPRLPVFNPSTGECIAAVSPATATEVDAAVCTARAAWPEWARLPVPRRAQSMFRFKNLLERDADSLAAVISREHGKTLGDAQAEIARALDVVEFACAAPQLLKGEFSEAVARNIDTYSVRQPLGVAVGISPFNFPVMVPLWMVPLALVCGNTFVLKPSERTPSSSLMLAQLLSHSGVPPGVFNVVQGDRVAVHALVTHPNVDAVSFVGSSAVARDVYMTATLHGKRVQALGGAKNHMVILQDADIERAADALVSGAFGSAGERCMAISVAVPVGERTANQLRHALTQRIGRLRVGSSDDPRSDMGPMITREHRARVCAYIDAGIKEGAELVIDGRSANAEWPPSGYYLAPTLFDRVPPSSFIYREEIFGPVLGIVRVETLADAARLINSHPYANGVAIFTQDGRSAREFSHAINVGMVGVNVPVPVPAAFHSFGGWRQSLFGDHHVHGMEGVRFYTRQKCITQRWRLDEGCGDFTLPTLS